MRVRVDDLCHFPSGTDSLLTFAVSARVRKRQKFFDLQPNNCRLNSCHETCVQLRYVLDLPHIHFRFSMMSYYLHWPSFSSRERWRTTQSDFACLLCQLFSVWILMVTSFDLQSTYRPNPTARYCFAVRPFTVQPDLVHAIVKPTPMKSALPFNPIVRGTFWCLV